MRSRVRSILALAILKSCVLLLLAGCAVNRNDPIATYIAIDGAYEITITGVRENMAHDPISFLFRGSSPMTATIRVPRITGQVNAEEIFRAASGGYRHFGRIEFTGSRMVVDIHYDNTDRKRVAPYSMNGEYVLQRAKASS